VLLSSISVLVILGGGLISYIKSHCYALVTKLSPLPCIIIISYSFKRHPPFLQVNLPQGGSNQIVFTVHNGCARATQRNKHVNTARHEFQV